ncbi:MAG: molybdate ABC transporter substrate-binding protein [Deltaproteobacteria bacterium GWF2_42_12]|nr:MAG: molybdate ABC transporter substrate-binding protein [Deltaproteobacteria bacterium GWD2_42_10]OGP48030.1 MAG: molybdate ABC transporter substrate-binding protein [Deltaproteobacteria bacterium GWF2_42_12]OGQ30487.1 MAG: molybdate ABC transporter substrate-binding protein [Deltaproteobacteria bacterium RIFCSPHIGHO2_02_FULL_42_44]OGQ35723.1 MAG: molybdate ABC transporter substrate-binding protein [Deltaproteobacteria bacterium RIFCSPLOWO2_02_FULL_42_39]OGQ70405.1 MAG: molybdate ABC transp
MTLYKNFKFLISNFKFQILLLTAYCVLLTTAGYAEPQSLTIAAPAQQGITTLSVAAASDLSFALKEISQQFEKESNIKVIISFGSTGVLSQQIENGAPFDIFFAANEKYINTLEEKGLIIPNTKQLYAQGRLVLAVHEGFKSNIKNLKDLLQPSVKRVAIANPDHAPYGIAAKEALRKLGLWDKLKPKLVYAENIRQAIQFIQTGDAHAGIVALSVINVPEVKYTIIDNTLHQPINQIVAIMRTTKAEKEARKFIDYVIKDGKGIMQRYGFVMP